MVKQLISRCYFQFGRFLSFCCSAWSDEFVGKRDEYQINWFLVWTMNDLSDACQNEGINVQYKPSSSILSIRFGVEYVHRLTGYPIKHVPWLCNTQSLSASVLHMSAQETHSCNYMVGFPCANVLNMTRKRRQRKKKHEKKIYINR